MIWNNDGAPNPEVSSPLNNGWKMEAKKNELVPVMTKSSPAPKAIINLVKWRRAKKQWCNNLCQWRKAGFTCTDLSFVCYDSEVLHNNRQEEDTKFDEEDYVTCKKFRTILISNRKVFDKTFRNFRTFRMAVFILENALSVRSDNATGRLVRPLVY